MIVFDPDYLSDYPPEIQLEIYLPSNYKIVYAKDIPHEELMIVLQRAKVSFFIEKSIRLLINNSFVLCDRL